MWCSRSWVSRSIWSLTIFLIGYVAWGSLFTPESLWAPGHLSRFHADISDCRFCHHPFKGPINQNCEGCHPMSRFRRQAQAEVTHFHENVMRRAQRCTACHTEHRGALAGLMRGGCRVIRMAN